MIYGGAERLSYENIPEGDARFPHFFKIDEESPVAIQAPVDPKPEEIALPVFLMDSFGRGKFPNFPEFLFSGAGAPYLHLLFKGCKLLQIHIFIGRVIIGLCTRLVFNRNISIHIAEIHADSAALEKVA